MIYKYKIVMVRVLSKFWA